MLRRMTRVLLVEVVAQQRLHRAIAFPFVQGYLRSRGVPARWIRFAVPADARSHATEPGVGLPQPLVEKLLAIVRRGDVTHLLLHPEPSHALQDAVDGLRLELRAGHLVDTLPRRQPEPGPWPPVEASVGGIDQFMGEEERCAREGNLFDEVTPDYEWEAGHDEARLEPSLPFIVCGEECTYNRSVQGNPCFADVDLSDCARPWGCTFCARPPGARTWKHRPEVLIRTQLDAVRRTHPKSKERLAIRAVGEPVLRNLETAARVLRELSLAPCDLLIDARADAIVSIRESMERALRVLSGSGHTVQLCLTGIESFVSSDLARMNKGVSWQQNLDAIRALFEWERAWPCEFGFRAHGGLSLLLMTPWTRLHELSLNYAVVRRALLQEVCGKLFTSRLRLSPDLPLHALAQRDGLLQTAYDDPLLDTARLNFYSEEVPWRFEQPEMDVVNRLLLRLEPGLARPDDPFLQALAPIAGPDADRLQVAEALIDAAMAVDAGGDAEQRIADARRMVAVAADSLRPVSLVPLAEASDGPQHESGLPAEIIAVLAGVKPVGRVETRGALPASMAPSIDPGLVVESRVRREGDTTVWDTFVGRDRGQVLRAIELTDAPDAATWKESTHEVGSLLGYPDCCTRAFASREYRVREFYSWMHVLLRIGSAGEVSPLLNPGSEMAVSWVPCSLQCEATLDLARRTLAAIEQHNGRAAASRVEQELRRPWLLLADHQGHAAELIAEHEPVGRFTYRTGRVRGSAHPLLRKVMQGDSMEIDDQQILVLERGRVIASLGCRAFVWWHAAAVQRDLWTRIVDLRFMPRRATAQAADGSEAATGAQPGPVVRLLRVLLRDAMQQHESFEGFRVSTIEREAGDVARVLLRGDQGDLPILIAAGRSPQEAWLTVGPLAIYHRREEPIDTPQRQSAVRLLGRHLEGRMRERLRGAARS